MNNVARMRERLAVAKVAAENVQRACDEAQSAIRAGDEGRARIYIGCAYSEAVRVKVAATRACDALNRMPLDGLLTDSLARTKRKCFGVVNGGKP